MKRSMYEVAKRWGADYWKREPHGWMLFWTCSGASYFVPDDES